MKITVESIKPRAQGDGPVMNATVRFHLEDEGEPKQKHKRYNNVEVDVHIDKSIKDIDAIHAAALDRAYDVLQKIIDRRS